MKKNKSIIIDGDLHQRLKIFCKGKSMKIGGVVENLIRTFLNNPKELENMFEERFPKSK